MRNIVLVVVAFSSLSLSMNWLFKPTFSPTQDEQVRLQKEYKLLCKRYTQKSSQYMTRELENAFYLKAVVYFDMKKEKYCQS